MVDTSLLLYSLKLAILKNPFGRIFTCAQMHQGGGVDKCHSEPSKERILVKSSQLLQLVLHLVGTAETAEMRIDRGKKVAETLVANLSRVLGSVEPDAPVSLSILTLSTPPPDMSSFVKPLCRDESPFNVSSSQAEVAAANASSRGSLMSILTSLISASGSVPR